MSILWEKHSADSCYQVRQAGRSLRLYTNGVLHSQYNPARPVTGSVWDLLWLPAFFYAPGQLRRVLVLGVGGGNVIRHLQDFVAPDAVMGIDLNPVHLAVARRFFKLTGQGLTLKRADASDWVRHYRGPAFDMIVDDLFGDYDGEPQRAVAAGEHWASSLTGLLSDNGVLVSNFATRLELETSAYLLDKHYRKRFASAFSLATAQNYNSVGVFLGKPVTTRTLRTGLKRVPALDPRRASGVRYRIKTLW